MHPSKSTYISRPSTTSRSSRTGQSQRLSLTASTIITNKYPKCDIKKQHNKQILNLVCLTDTCKNKGAICSMCKSNQHSTHIVLPVKKFLQRIQQCLKQKQAKGQKKVENKIQNQSNLPSILQQPQPVKKIDQIDTKKQQQVEKLRKEQLTQNIIQLIEKTKNKMLYNLSLYINSLADNIRTAQQKIISDAEAAIQNIKNIQNLQNNLATITSELQQESYEDSNIYKSRIQSLLNYVKVKNKQQFQISSQGVAKISQNYVKMSQNFTLNVQHWYTESNRLLLKLFEHNPNLKQPQVQKGLQNLRFSTDLKIKSIELSNDNKIAKLNQKLPGFVLGVSSNIKQKSFKLKILHLESSIILGVGFKDIIKTNQFKFTSNNIGHGVYAVGHNSNIYSHHSKNHNSVLKGMSFLTGQQISLYLKGETVHFVKKSDSKTVTIPLKKMTDQDWKQLSICAWLGGVGDKIQIIQ